jgi:hypothetical protein
VSGAGTQKPSAPHQTPWLALAWLSGVAALGAVVAWQHRRWSRQLRWDRVTGTWLLPAGNSPSVVGLLRPRLALPVDFEKRFSAQERAGILAHEAVHAKRHDNLWNAVATGFWIVNWFNPLAWWALRAFQRDQELACDAAALAARTAAERDAYRDALLKAFEISPSSALSRGWRSTHPLIERLQWVQSGFVERTMLSALVVLLIVQCHGLLRARRRRLASLAEQASGREGGPCASPHGDAHPNQRWPVGGGCGLCGRGPQA